MNDKYNILIEYINKKKDIWYNVKYIDRNNNIDIYQTIEYNISYNVYYKKIIVKQRSKTTKVNRIINIHDYKLNEFIDIIYYEENPRDIHYDYYKLYNTNLMDFIDNFKLYYKLKILSN